MMMAAASRCAPASVRLVAAAVVTAAVRPDVEDG
jgi:hypothetical protein